MEKYLILWGGGENKLNNAAIIWADSLSSAVDEARNRAYDNFDTLEETGDPDEWADYEAELWTNHPEQLVKAEDFYYYDETDY